MGWGLWIAYNKRIEVPEGYWAKGVAEYPQVALDFIYGMPTSVGPGKFNSKPFIVLRSLNDKIAWSFQGKALGTLKAGKRQSYKYMVKGIRTVTFLQ